MKTPTLSEIKKRAQKYWDFAVKIFDHDKFKAVLYPDRDWGHLLSLFVVLVILFIVFSGYLYYGLKSYTVSGDNSGQQDTATVFDGINATIKIIDSSEKSFAGVSSKVPAVSDPSR